MPDGPVLVEVHIEIPVGATLNNTYRNERGVTLQLWATPEAKEKIVAMLAPEGAAMSEHYVTAISPNAGGLCFVACACGWLASSDEGYVEILWREHREGSGS